MPVADFEQALRGLVVVHERRGRDLERQRLQPLRVRPQPPDRDARRRLRAEDRRRRGSRWRRRYHPAGRPGHHPVDHIGQARYGSGGGQLLATKCIVSAPSYISTDLPEARQQVRVFPAMVSNHVQDLIDRYADGSTFCGRSPTRSRAEVRLQRALRRREARRVRDGRDLRPLLRPRQRRAGDREAAPPRGDCSTSSTTSTRWPRVGGDVGKVRPRHPPRVQPGRRRSPRFRRHFIPPPPYPAGAWAGLFADRTPWPGSPQLLDRPGRPGFSCSHT